MFCLSVRRLLLTALLPLTLVSQNVITTVAGVDPVFGGDGQPAVNVPLGYINGVATDGSGNIYFTDPIEHLVLKVSATGILSVIAGNGIADYSGDGGPATSAAIASFDSPDDYVTTYHQVGLGGIAVDGQGNVFFGDGQYVRRIATDGTISTVAGGGTKTLVTGGPATQASLGIVNGLAFDSSGNLYFTENNHIRKLTPDGNLTIFAGAGGNGFSGDGGPAIAAKLSQPLGLAFDAQGNLYFADGDAQSFNSRIRKIATSGTITTFAGGGNKFPADGVAPLSLDLTAVSGVAVDSAGAIYAFAPYNGILVRIANGVTALVTGTTAKIFADNQPARNAYIVGQRLYDNSGIAFDSAGNLYVADSRDGRLCKIDKQGNLFSIAGNGKYGFGGDFGLATSANLQGPAAMTQTPDGSVYFLDTLNARVRRIAPSGVITTVFSSENFPLLGNFETLNGLTSDPNGNIYVLLIHRLVEVMANGTLQVILNSPNAGTSSGDGGSALQASILSGGGVTRDVAGNLYISDPDANRIRKITVDGRIQTIAGNGTRATVGDGALAASSSISAPSTVLADSLGGLYFEEAVTDNLGATVIRYITPDGHLKTIAGNGSGVFSGDGGLATQAGLVMQKRTGVAVDKAGNVYIADGLSSRVRVVGTNGIINTFAGNGTPGNAGDGGLAKNANLYTPRGLLFNASGDLLISDVSANRIRAVLANPPPAAVSPGQLSFSGKAGGALTPPQKLTLTSPVSGLSFTVSTSPGADWLVLSSAGGATPRLYTVRADPSSLAPGSYQATITVTFRQAVPAVNTISVTFQVSQGDNPRLSLDKSGLSFTFPSKPTTTRTQQIRVSNAGTGTLAYTARALTGNGGNWLTVSPASGTATPQTPAIVAVTANPAGLAAGTYTGSVTITSSTSGESSSVQINLTVSTLDQAIQLSHTALSFTAVSGGSVVPARSFAITNIGRGAMSFSVSTRTLAGGSQWLSATPSSGTSVNGAAAPPVIVTVNQAGLAPGIYYGQVAVVSPAAANTPQVVTVVLNVLGSDQDPGPVIEPSEIVFTAMEGAPPPGSKPLLVYNISATPQTYVSGVLGSNANDRLDFDPQNTTLSLTHPTRIVVQPLTAGLAPGVYDAELTLQFSDGFVRRAVVRTIVTPAPASTANSPASATTSPANCTASQLVPAITSLGQSFGVPAAWPVVLEAEIRDDCGVTLDSGSVKIAFSNGDPPLSMQSIQSGLWHTTWVSGSNSGQVTLTLTANDPARSLTATREVTGGLGDSSQAPVLAAAVSAASFAGNVPLAPNSIISLFGQGLANGIASAAVIPLNTTLSGATVLMAGKELPLIFSSGGQINAVVSSGININTNQQIVVERGTTLSVPISVDVGPAEPAIFGYPVPGAPPNQGAIVNALTYAVAQPASPVSAGDILAIFCTGLGAVDQSVADGSGAPGSPVANTIVTPTVSVGGKNAIVAFSGLAPGLVGLYQIDAFLPAGIPPGNQVPVIVSISGQTSPAATIAVK